MSRAQLAQVRELEALDIPPGIARKAIQRAAAVSAAQGRAARRGDERAIAKCRAAVDLIVEMVFAERRAS